MHSISSPVTIAKLRKEMEFTMGPQRVKWSTSNKKSCKQERCKNRNKSILTMPHVLTIHRADTQNGHHERLDFPVITPNISPQHAGNPDSVQLHTLHSGLMESYQLQKLRDQSRRSRAQSDNTDYKLTIPLRIIMPTSVHNKIPLRVYLLGFRSLGLKYSATPYSLQYWSNINNEGNSGLNSVILCTRPICGLSLENLWKYVSSLGTIAYKGTITYKTLAAEGLLQ